MAAPYRRPLPTGRHSWPARGRPAPGARDVLKAWARFAAEARLSARDPDDADAALSLTGARKAVAGRGLPTVGHARGHAGRALYDLTEDWSIRTADTRREFARAVLGLAELVADLAEAVSLAQAAQGRRMCGSDD